MEAINLKFRAFLKIPRIFVMAILFIGSKVVPTTVNNSLFNNNGLQTAIILTLKTVNT